jgi:phosphoribosylamine---glycine ligase
MKIGLVGSGGREHALGKVLMRNPHRDSLYVYSGHINPGILPLAKHITIGNLLDVQTIVDYFMSTRVDLVVIGPEAPLMHGTIDLLRKNGIAAFGPTRAQARLEGDKSFMRDILTRRVGWGSPAWRKVDDLQDAHQFIQETGQVVVKPIGLTGGKGVRVMGEHLTTIDDTLMEVEQWIRRDGKVLLEERVIGEEFSRMVIATEGKAVPMPIAQDFKYAYDGDLGNMTGGMGSYTMADGSLPFISPQELSEADRLLHAVIDAISEECQDPYCGFLYGQFMVTSRGVRAIEFNVRLGDPEAINMMSLLQGDAPEIFLAATHGELDPDQIHFLPQASVCKYLVPQEYPDRDVGQLEFNLDESKVEEAGLSLICASVAENGHLWQTLGSRALAILGLGDHPGPVSTRIEDLLERCEPSVLRHRRDVGDDRIIQAKIERMAHLRRGGMA